jgi:hypothetical protein
MCSATGCRDHREDLENRCRTLVERGFESHPLAAPTRSSLLVILGGSALDSGSFQRDQSGVEVVGAAVGENSQPRAVCADRRDVGARPLPLRSMVSANLRPLGDQLTGCGPDQFDQQQPELPVGS